MKQSEKRGLKNSSFFYLREKRYSFKFGKDITIRPGVARARSEVKAELLRELFAEAIRVLDSGRNELPAEESTGSEALQDSGIQQLQAD